MLEFAHINPYLVPICVLHYTQSCFLFVQKMFIFHLFLNQDGAIVLPVLLYCGQYCPVLLCCSQFWRQPLASWGKYCLNLFLPPDPRSAVIIIMWSAWSLITFSNKWVNTIHLSGIQARRSRTRSFTGWLPITMTVATDWMFENLYVHVHSTYMSHT